jgi:hypothetical protein
MNFEPHGVALNPHHIAYSPEHDGYARLNAALHSMKRRARNDRRSPLTDCLGRMRSAVAILCGMILSYKAKRQSRQQTSTLIVSAITKLRRRQHRPLPQRLNTVSLILVFVGAVLIALGLVMLGNREGYFYFIVRPRAVLGLALVGAASAWVLSGTHAETDDTFIVSQFPACKGTPVFSPYAAGAVGAIEAKQRADWFAKLKPIASAPCVLRSDGGITFCGKLVCRNIVIN